MRGRRWAVAKTIARELRDREGSNLVAVGVYGSVARGEDREFSDLDLFVVLRRKRSWIRPVFREGVYVTPSLHTPAEAREEATGSGPWLCEKLGGWYSMRSLFDPRRFLSKVATRARHPTAAQFRGSARNDLIATFEDYGKVLNAVAAEDADDVREMSVWFTGGAGGALLDIEGRAMRTDHEMTAVVRSNGGSAATSCDSGTRRCHLERRADSRNASGGVSSNGRWNAGSRSRPRSRGLHVSLEGQGARGGCRRGGDGTAAAIPLS